MLLTTNNLIMKQFQLNLEKLITESQLSVGQLYYILKSELNDIENLYNQLIQQEYIEMQKSVENEKEESSGQE